MRFGLAEELISKLSSVFRRHEEIEEVVIYGSRAKGNFRPGSDIDLTFKGKKVEPSILGTIAQEIDDLNSPYLFDLSVYDSLKSEDLLEHINRVGQTFYVRTR